MWCSTSCNLAVQQVIIEFSFSMAHLLVFYSPADWMRLVSERAGKSRWIFVFQTPACILGWRSNRHRDHLQPPLAL